MKNFRKIAITLASVTLLSGTAFANSGRDVSPQENSCRMDFKTPWLAFMYIPCVARQMF